MTHVLFKPSNKNVHVWCSVCENILVCIVIYCDYKSFMEYLTELFLSEMWKLKKKQSIFWGELQKIYNLFLKVLFCVMRVWVYNSQSLLFSPINIWHTTNEHRLEASVSKAVATLLIKCHTFLTAKTFQETYLCLSSNLR